MRNVMLKEYHKADKRIEVKMGCSCQTEKPVYRSEEPLFVDKISVNVTCIINAVWMFVIESHLGAH